MNFLGHLFFSNDNPELMYANLYGDFFKGKDPGKYSSLIQSGITLHRNIDYYIDNHPKVINLMHQLYPELPKVTGIAIDLYFDYLLAQNWTHFHPIPYQEFLNKFYDYQPKLWGEYTEEFRLFICQLKKHRWLDYYPTLEGLRKASEGVSSRISFETKLSKASEVYLKHEIEISSCFEIFMQDAIPFFQNKIKNLNI